jgi:hypothetical protein
MKLRWILIALACAATLATPAVAGKKYGKQVRYAGVHPIPKGEGGGMCHIEGPHVHIFAANKLEYRLHDDNYVFIGDPVAYGWDGPKYAYKGNHPVHVEAVVGGPADVEYCYINGPHYHYFEPEGTPEVKLVGGAYFWVGTPPPAYVDARPQYVAINATYEPIRYTRPVIEVAPPVGWVNVEVGGPAVVVDTRPPPPVVVAPRGRVEAGIGVDVHIPVPSIQVGIGVAPAPVIIHERGHGHGKFKHKKWKKH